MDSMLVLMQRTLDEQAATRKQAEVDAAAATAEARRNEAFLLKRASLKILLDGALADRGITGLVWEENQYTKDLAAKVIDWRLGVEIIRKREGFRYRGLLSQKLSIVINYCGRIRKTLTYKEKEDGSWPVAKVAQRLAEYQQEFILQVCDERKRAAAQAALVRAQQEEFPPQTVAKDATFTRRPDGMYTMGISSWLKLTGDQARRINAILCETTPTKAQVAAEDAWDQAVRAMGHLLMGERQGCRVSWLETSDARGLLISLVDPTDPSWLQAA